MTDVIKVPFKLGTRVFLTSREADETSASAIEALVTAVCLRDGSITFECAYIYEGKRRADWFTAPEMIEMTGRPNGMRIGFGERS